MFENAVQEIKSLLENHGYNLSNDEINSLKELLYNSYSIEKTRIHINE